MKTDKNMTNLQVANLLRNVGIALTLTPGDNRFRVIAYEKAAEAIEHSTTELKDLWSSNQLNSLPGIGEALTAHINELFKTGKVKHFNTLFKSFPPALFILTEIPGIGPKTAVQLCKQLGLNKAHTAIEKLEKAAQKHRIQVLPGFGEGSELEIIRGITQYKNRTGRMLLPEAQAIAESVITWLKESPYVQKIDPLGSLRRQVATIGDVDIAVASDNAPAVIEHFKAYPQKSRVLEAGTFSASLILPNDRQVDLMVEPPASYGSLLQHFTGSKHHNIQLREYALKKNLSLSEHGIKTSTGVLTFSNEEKFYNYLGLQWIPPELREGRSEINQALNKNLPNLITVTDIKGDLQVHTNLNTETSHDLGSSTLEELVSFAKSLGYEYIGATEHNPSVSNHTVSQVIDLIKRKSEKISQFSGSVHIFNGLEIDIQPDGTRSLPDQALDLLDYACVSIHSSFHMSKKQNTDRIIRALDHPKVRFLAHPTGRLIGERDGVDIDWDRLFAYCKEHHKWLEIDAWPNRLDLTDTQVFEAVKNGVKIVIDSDSHSANHLPNMRFGVAVARRAGLSKEVVINTMSLNQVQKLLATSANVL